MLRTTGAAIATIGREGQDGPMGSGIGPPLVSGLSNDLARP